MADWAISVSAKLVVELAKEFHSGPIIDDRGRRRLEEALVAEVDGLQVEIFSNEHPPPHFRVRYQGRSANFDICTGEPLTNGLEKWRRNIRKWHAENRQTLIDSWNRRRPTDCPVGRVECK